MTDPDPSQDPEIDADTDVDNLASNSKSNDGLNLPEDLTQTTPQQQRILMKRLGIKVQATGDSWYPIDKKWYDSWQRYTMFSKGDDDIPGGIDKLHEIGEPRPDKIDNSSLADTENPSQLKKDIQENLTHVWIHSDVWDLLYAWYGGGPSFERKVYERGGSYTKEKYICIYPQMVKVCYCDDSTGAIDESKYELKAYPPDYTLKQMAKDLEEELEFKTDARNIDTPYIHFWLQFAAFKNSYTIDKAAVKVTLEDLAKEDQTRYIEVPDDYLKTKLQSVALYQQKAEQEQNPSSSSSDPSPSSSSTTTSSGRPSSVAIEDPNAVMRDVFVVVEKKQSDNSWPRAKGDDWRDTLQAGDIIDCKDAHEKWYETLVRYVHDDDDTKYPGEMVVHYIGWNIKWDERVKIMDETRVCKRHTKTFGPHRPRPKKYGGGGGGHYNYNSSFSYWKNENGPPDQRGVVGLRNLGNTCFMNSTLQCLAQSPQLTDYFLKNDYIHHVNMNNPLGWGGKVAKAWAGLLHDMFSSKYKVIAPRQFKEAIGDVAPRFMGYAQQDSQELLSFLLDGLHEDLNQIENKPMTEAVESAGRPDKVVAIEAWKTYLKRNQSIIVDLMQGQYRSEVECPDCGRISITFDPYMFLSVPLPTEKYKIIQYTYVDNDTTIPPTVYGIKMLKVADIQMLKESVARRHKVDKDELFVCDIWKSKIHRELRRHDSVGDINRKSDDIFIYHSQRPDIAQWKKEAGDTSEPVEEAEEDERRNGAGNAGGPAAGNYNNYNQYNNGRRNGKNQEFQTFVVNNTHRVLARPQYSMHGQQRYDDEPMGFPLLLTLPMQVKVTMKQIRNKLWSLIKPFLQDETLELDDPKLPFVLWVAWGFNNMEKIVDSEEQFDLNLRNLKFLVHWSKPEEYKTDMYAMQNRPRDDSAPAAVDQNSMSMDDEDNRSSGYGRRGAGKPIDLSACLNAFCEKETLSENDAWYCSKCKDFKCASKKIDLWGSPDLLIIHLKRFSYTRNWRDRINTLVHFPIEGLDLSPFLLNDDEKADAVYDLFGVSNHMGGMGGGHYTAYAKNLDNQQWYHLDDSRTSKVHNVQQIVSSSAYVLYYYRRKPRLQKHRASRVIVPDVPRRLSQTTQK